MRAVASVALISLLLALPARGDAPKPGSFEVEVVKDVAYNTDKGASKERHTLDLYLPKGQKDYPVLFFIHGGGWRKGSNKGFARHGTMFARHGIGFVAINYRLTEHPEHIQDVARAFAWAHANLGKRGAKTDLIFVSGHSAGGHLAALLATDESHLKAHKLGLNNIKGVVPVSGVFFISPRMSKIFGDEKSCKAASPITHVREKLPPMLILYAESEIAGLGKQAESFGEALTKAKCEAKVVKIDKRNHGSIMGNIARPDDPATKLIFEFINKHAGTKIEPVATPKKE
jgi:acetyl esterase/lipase